MATNITLKPPGRFDFRHPDEWPKWKRRFTQYLAATGLDQEGDVRKVSTLLYCMGEEGDDVLTSTNISAANRKKFDTVLNKFDSFFDVRKNVIYERAKFNQRNQAEGESAEQYITALYSLVDTCNYGALKEEMLRDRLVVGIKDKTMSQKLQMMADLTLEKAKKEIRQKEAVCEQQQELQAGVNKPCNNLDEVKQKPQSRYKISKRGQHYKPQSNGGGARLPKQSQACMRCGKPYHSAPNKCPALSSTCFKCHRKGHYGSQCKSKTMAEVEVSTDEEEIFLGAVTSKKDNTWTVTVQLQQKDIQFKMDTGAEVTVISDKVYNSLPEVQLSKPTKTLYGPARQKLDVMGQFTGILTHGNHTHSENIFVVRDLQTNLLGLPSITSLQLIQRIDATLSETMTIQEQFPKVFTGLGTLGDEYTIKLKDDAQPYALHTPRRVPFPQRKQVQDELNRMESLGVISKVSDPTPWCAGMVVVPKKDGSVRICVDLKPLNESVLREVHPIPRVEEVLAQLTGATVFSKIDANSGFWQIPLSPESRPLTTFITPFGRYWFNKLPFGISSAPELFQKRMNKILEGLEGVTGLIDDTLIYGKDMAEHDARLAKVMERLEASDVTLNGVKCVFRKSSMKFLGQLISKDGVRADPEKTSAVRNMEVPHSVSDLRRFLGMVNQLGKFSPRISELTQPMRELLSNKRAWLWGPEQDEAFKKVKEELSVPTSLALYNPSAQLKVSADASSFGLGAVLFQHEEDTWKPVVYASRSMSETERRYAQIEKEALATTWACEKFTDYILGKRFLIETDHKPLVPLLNTKQLDCMPPRILRFRLRLARYDYLVHHVPGKEMYTADTLSRAPLAGSEGDVHLEKEVESFVVNIVKSIPATQQGLNKYRQAQLEDPVCQQIAEYCQHGWPGKASVRQDVAPYWQWRDAITQNDELLMYAHRIIVPKTLQKETLTKIHTGHQGIERCRARAAMSVWWPGISQHIAQIVQQCVECAKYATHNKEPLITTQLPEYPWQIVGTDLFEIDKTYYLLIVDYFSRYPEVFQLKSTTSTMVINVMKQVFSRHGIPEIVRSDNGPQYASLEFAEFSSSYDFQHITSSPKYPQSNGEAERMVQTIKRMLKKPQEMYMALLSYRSTPLPWCGLSPAELCMGRRLRTSIPQATKQMMPEWQYLEEFREKNKEYKKTQKHNFDKRHRTRDLPEIPEGSQVWIKSEKQPIEGTVLSSAGQPRSYVVDTPTGQLHRNRSHLKIIPQQSENKRSIQNEHPKSLSQDLEPNKLTREREMWHEQYSLVGCH